MISEALSCICDDVNDFFKLKINSKENTLVLSGIVNMDGSAALSGENKILVTLINIEKETTVNLPGKSTAGGAFAYAPPPLCINLDIMFSAYFSSNNYPEALRFISYIISYFQAKPVFTRQNTPRLDPAIEKLGLEMSTLSYSEMSNIWSSLGAKYLPSVIYRMRMLTIDDSVTREFRPGITSTDTAIAPA